MPIDSARFFPRDARVAPKGDRSGRLLVAAGISTYGDWLTVVALAVLLFDLTHQPEAPALYILARFAPRVLGPTLGGSLADRYGPSWVAGWSALGQCVLTVAIVVFANSGTIWAILVAVAGAGFLGSLAQPGYSATIPRVTPPARLLRVNAIYSGLFSRVSWWHLSSGRSRFRSSGPRCSSRPMPCRLPSPVCSCSRCGFAVP